MQGLWAGPWLRDVARLTASGIASNLFMMGCATMLGFLFWGNLATRLARRGISVFSVYVAGTGLFLLVQMLLALGWSHAPALLWMTFGFLGTAGSLSYAILSHQFPSNLAGRVNTALNSLVFAWAFLAQWLMGAIIGLWPTTATGYDPNGYRAGFAAFLAVQLLGWAAMLLLGRRAVASGSAGTVPEEKV
jgi:MFS family permease